VTEPGSWAEVYVLWSALESRPEQAEGREDAAQQEVGVGVEQVLLSAWEELAPCSCSAPSLLRRPFSRATTHFRPSRRVRLGHPSPKIPLLPGPRKHI
jgi:hypothetical protein